ncbi:SDR family oxidoreductase [Streptomyces kaempferi]
MGRPRGAGQRRRPGHGADPVLPGPVVGPGARAGGRANTALGRIAEPEDIVGAVLLFASDAGSYISGQTLLVDASRSIL